MLIHDKIPSQVYIIWSVSKLCQIKWYLIYGQFYVLLVIRSKRIFKSSNEIIPLIKGQKVRVIDRPTVFLGPLPVTALLDHNLEIKKIYCIAFIILPCSIKPKFFYRKFSLKTKFNNTIKTRDAPNQIRMILIDPLIYIMTVRRSQYLAKRSTWADQRILTQSHRDIAVNL